MLNTETDNRTTWTKELASARSDVERFGKITFGEYDIIMPEGTPELVWNRFINLTRAGQDRGWL